MKEQNKYIYAGILVVVVLLIIFIKKPSPPTTPVEESATQTQTSGDQKTVKPATNPKPTYSPTKTPAKTLSREEALATYDKVVRIDDVCVAETHTHSANLLENTVIMIDNDGKMSHTIVLPSRTVTLKAQSYTLENLPSGGSVSSSCNEETKVTTVVVK